MDYTTNASLQALDNTVCILEGGSHVGALLVDAHNTIFDLPPCDVVVPIHIKHCKCLGCCLSVIKKKLKVLNGNVLPVLIPFDVVEQRAAEGPDPGHLFLLLVWRHGVVVPDDGSVCLHHNSSAHFLELVFGQLGQILLFLQLCRLLFQFARQGGHVFQYCLIKRGGLLPAFPLAGSFQRWNAPYHLWLPQTLAEIGSAGASCVRFLVATTS
mmetsp:Transcript_9931/g.26979  ORF Transcript_9931/g.26979 Transcript_9931/m.26979 type:complete len:212 (-) Transcript_9931:4344-4979(-)